MYQYLFFKIYEWNKQVAPKSEQPVFNSILAISFLMFCNLITISIILEFISGIKILSFEVIKVIAVMLFILLLNYFLLGFKNRYKSIIERYSNMDVKSGGISVAIYIVLTIATLLFVLFYTAE